MQNKSSTRIALGGMSAALCLVIMMTTALMPFATYALPSLAGIFLIPIAMELGCNTAWITYIAVAILSLLIVPDREAALMFISFFGYYPILKIYIDRLKNGLLRGILKLLVFNTAMTLAYAIIIYVFGLYYLLEEFAGGWGIALLVIGNIFFPIYEIAVASMYKFYIYRIRKTIFRQ